MKISTQLRIMSAIRSCWMTPVEAAQAVGQDWPGYIRRQMHAMADAGYLKRRPRPNPGRGGKANEFRVASEWGGLES